MKILIIMEGFFPGTKFGGPPVSIDNFCSLMKEDECYIVTKNHDKDETRCYNQVETGKWLKRNNCSIIYLQSGKFSKQEFSKIIYEINPDVIYLQSLFQSCVLPCLYLANKYHKKVLLAPRGELCSGAFKKKYKKIPYILFLRIFNLLKNVNFQSTSNEETDAIKQYFKVSNDKILFLTNIPSILKYNYVFKTKIKGNGNFIFISRIHPKKNLKYAIKCFNTIKGNVNFDIYGSLEDVKYWEECKIEIAKLPENINIKYCGIVPHEKVHEVFSKYDALFLPTLSENYGHVIVESLLVGTPVIISDQTPWTDINEEKVGWSISLDKQLEFSKVIQKIVDEGNESFSQIHIKCKEYINKKNNYEKLKKEYQ